MSDDLLAHLIGQHPGVHVPWFTGSGYIERLSVEQLARLHAELHAQGENHDNRRQEEPIRLSSRSSSPKPVRPPVCRRFKCLEEARGDDGLCARHDAEYQGALKR